MLSQIHQLIFILACFTCFVFFNIRAFSFCQSIHTQIRSKHFGLSLSLAINSISLSLALFCGLPILLSFLITYLTILLQFLLLFQGDFVELAFTCGTFLFHIMNVKMVVSSIFILVYGIPCYEEFREGGLYYFNAFVTILLLLVSLEIFQKMITRQMLQLLMENRRQLRFVTSSMMLINVYLLILSTSYGGQAYSGMTAIFLLCTSLLLFGAFYTSFLHGIKMSALMGYEAKSRQLERQLKQRQGDIAELQAAAFTDTLTEVHNRRFGMDELNRLLREQVPFCVCFLDIDHLKYVNDTYGHEEGDRYILDVAKILSRTCTKGDTLCRLGGDEFMILLPHASLGAARERMDGVFEAVSRLPSTYSPSISYGISEVEAGTPLDVSQIVHQADQAMYQFKQSHPASRIR